MRVYNWLCCAVILLSLFVTVSCSLGASKRPCVVIATQKGPPAHAPAHGYRRKHMGRYHYYPSAFVYFDLERKLYFYMESGHWKVGVKLPADIRIEVGEAVSLSLETDKPYLHFEAHKAKYPPGQLKKHHGGPGKSKGKR